MYPMLDGTRAYVLVPHTIEYTLGRGDLSV